MCGQYEYFGYLHMLRCISGIHGNISNIIAGKRLDTLIDIGCPIIVATETDIAEVCLYQTRFQIGNTDGGVSHIDT